MATEQRLIDANAYPCQTCEVSYCHQNCAKFIAWFEKTVDAAEVVRCRECRHSSINENHPNKPLICYMTKKCGTTAPDWFCADGERRE